ncbi:apolipoprotein D and lipocalin family protein [Erwinia persicina]|jgi:apolipoprotein D and lipocalin family protein|uniref:Outer membrane lipoprotein Blc n=2 Tax=Erwinia TaxID=551 RepID=A0ABV4E5F5_9GAMM|nr:MULTISPECIES: lipocalin family protein [Erwinia]MCP1438541.1 apolipoprotein D and lipocalin family protein [Erwinia persicina]MDN4629326.1 lipocalin family protein [Erwinia sp. PsM31]MDN8542166.1 lipocalin family protein [Erwinia sp. BC051422]
MSLWKMLAAGAGALLSVACTTTPPKGVTPIEGFNADLYLGSWYEIARLDHRFERGLDHVTATYSKRDDGGLKVINRGFNVKKQRWQESIGKAYFTGSPSQAALKVSFFGPFYGGYNVIALDKDYQHALVCGPNRNYLWILSRTPQLDGKVKEELTAKARQAGFDVNKLIWVKQD